MIYVKIETQSRALRPRPVYVRGDNWTEVLNGLAQKASYRQGDKVWHTVKMHTVSEAEYNRNTHPEFKL